MTGEAAADPRGRSFMDRATTAAAVVALVGAVWFGALSLPTAWAYEPVNVSPRDLGLSSSAILVQATVGLAVTVVIGVVVGTVAAGIWGALLARRDPELRQLADKTPLPFRSDDPESNAAAVAMLRHKTDLSEEQAEQFVRDWHSRVTTESVASLRAFAPADVPDEVLSEIVKEIQREIPRAQMRAQAAWTGAVVGAVFGSVLALIACLIAVGVVAFQARDSIHAGRAPGFVLGLPAPWSANVAYVYPVGDALTQGEGALPPCALFLGQHDSTVFLRDGSARTLRVPASTVRLDLPDLNRCP